MWGCSPSEALSYRSVGPTKHAGVAVLVSSDYKDYVRPWNQHLWNSRVIGVTFKDMHIMNVYAPASNPEAREKYFTSLRDWKCELELSPTEHFTHWQVEAASRIDRCYIANSPSKWLQWRQVKLAPVPSDHDEVTMYLRDPNLCDQRKPRQRSIYPIQGAHKVRLRNELLRDLNAQESTWPGKGTHHWDQWIGKCKKVIKRVTRRDKQRRNRKARRLQRQQRENTTSRAQLLRTLLEDLRAHNEELSGNRLERKPSDVRWLFKKTAIWEHEQTISSNDPPIGMTFKEDDTIPVRFAKVREPIMRRQTQSGQPRSNANSGRVVRHGPVERKVSKQDNYRLMVPISEDDLLEAVAELQRHKAAGVDGLNNGFYLDLAPVMLPRLVAVCNEILQGQALPESF
ncbi:hypothetical protein PHMEG_0007213 [Phytophthora megakarya]|uniref:Reverse transcriptase n=1 Tax=Phytophthora megakarya TaxID=4795 RepID=A0A225WM70_9STRA|nr:hypothetical protein PHMEG_0007213 [Phytophthora megakarya]